MLAAASLALKAETPSTHTGAVESVAFSPDGKSIVSGSNCINSLFGMQLRVWDAGVSALAHPNP